GTVQVGSNQSQPASITNSGGATVTITQATATGAGFSITGPTLPLVLAPGQGSPFSVTFAPQASGSVNGSIAFSGSGLTATLPLTGAGQAAATLAAIPTSVNFGTVQVGSSQSHSQTLTNTGGSLLHISTATVTGAGFATSGLSVPTTLNAGQSLTFNVTFTPQSSGNSSGSLALTADGSVSNL